MVRTALKAVTGRFVTKAPEKPVVRRLIIMIRLVDGDWVLEKEHNLHQPRQRYKDEAKTVFRGLFTSKPREATFCAKTSTDDVLLQVLGFRQPDDIEIKPHFTRNGVEFHPVMLHLDYYGFSSTYIKERGNLEGRRLYPLSEHQYAEKLRKVFPE